MRTKIEITGYEVVQSIQNVGYKDQHGEDQGNEVSLLRGKDTYLRVYFSKKHYHYKYDAFTCKLKISFPNQSILGKEYEVLNEVEFHENATLMEQRLDWNKSINFKIPGEHLKTVCDENESDKNEIEISFSLYEVRFRRKNDWNSSGPPSSNFFSGKYAPLFKKIFQPPSVLNLRLVGYRYSDFEQSIEVLPTEAELRTIQEFVQSAFPISTLNCSTIIIDAPREFRKLRSTTTREERALENIDLVYTLMFQHLLAIRNQDISQKLAVDIFDPETTPASFSVNDDKTIYMGVISDPTGRLGGAVMKIPRNPSPHIVAFAEPDPEGALGAHELAHQLGRLHPGIPDSKIHTKFLGQANQYGNGNHFCNSCSVSGIVKEPTRPVEDYRCVNRYGLISFDQSNDRKIVLGIDQRKSITKRNILRHDENHDLMTYRFPQWISPHSYEGILCWIREFEEKDFENGSDKNSVLTFVNVIGEYQLNARIGAIKSVLPTSLASESLYTLEDSEIKSDLKLRVIYHVKRSEPLDKIQGFQESSNRLDDSVQKLIDALSEPGIRNCLDNIGECIVEVEFPIELKVRETDSNQEIGVFQQVMPAFKPNPYINLRQIFLTHDTRDIAIFDPPNPPAGFVPNLPAPDDPDPDPIYIEYDVDNDSFFLNYDLLRLDDLNPDDGKKLTEDGAHKGNNTNNCLETGKDKDIISNELSIQNSQPEDNTLRPNVGISPNIIFRPFSSLLARLQVDGVVTTTIQFKRNSNLPDECNPHCSVGGNWQTVAVSNRRNERIWLNPVVSARLSSRGRDEAIRDELKNREKTTVHEFSRIEDIHGKKYCEQGIKFRVLVSFDLITLVLFDSDSGAIFNDPRSKLKSLEFRVKANGSLGQEQENYFVKTSETKQDKKLRKYYKSTVLSDSDKQKICKPGENESCK